MSQKNDRCKPLSATTNRESLLALRDWLLPDSSIFAALRPHGNTVWLPVSLVWMSLIWSWSESRNLTDAVTEAALGMAVAKLFALKEQLSARRPKEKANEPPADPAKLSLAGTMRALREALRYPDDVSRKGQDLSSRLGAAVIDSYARKANEEREKLHEIERKTTPE